MWKRFRNVVLLTTAFVVLFLTLGGGELFCGECGNHNVVAEHDHTATDNTVPQHCDCTCHSPMEWVSVATPRVTLLHSVGNIFTLVQVAPSAPVADIDRPPQLA